MATTLLNPLYPRPHISTVTGNVASGVMLSVSSSSTPTSFTSSITNATGTLDGATELVFLDIQGANVVVTYDGSTPANGTNGHILSVGTNYTWQLGTVLKAKFVSQSATSASIFASNFSM